jgi:hypothetical protein
MNELEGHRRVEGVTDTESEAVEDGGGGPPRRALGTLRPIIIWLATIVGAAIGAVAGPELRDRLFPPARSVSVERFCLDRDTADPGHVMFAVAFRLHLVGYKHHGVYTFTNVYGPTNEPVDFDLVGKGDALFDGGSTVRSEATDQTLVTNDFLGFKPGGPGSYSITGFVADTHGHFLTQPNLDQTVPLRVVVDRNGQVRLPHPCVGHI